MKPRLRTVLYFFTAIFITALLSVAATVTIMNLRRGDRVMLDSGEYKSMNELTPLMELMSAVENEHYGKPVSDGQMIDGALRGAMQSIGDPYARYYTEQEYVKYLEQLDGAYHGIGALVGQPEGQGVPVLKVYDDSPAEEAGLKVGDVLLSVDGTALKGLTMEEVEALFSGKDGTTLQVTLLRGGKEQTLPVTRGAGVTHRVSYRLLEQRTGYIRIDKFTGTAAEEFKEALRDLTDRGMRSLVIDLRDNPGGELAQVTEIADALLGEGVIVTVRGGGETEDVYRSDTKSVRVPLAVIVNGNSASASEILAGAVQDSDSGVIVGEKTYGKGVVQTTMQLKSNGGWIKLTTAAYYTPSGRNVDGVGIEPDISVELDKSVQDRIRLENLNLVDDISDSDDAQLLAAVDKVRDQAQR
ncbi:MAG: S41 family peptidase [Bacillota bacterium]